MKYEKYNEGKQLPNNIHGFYEIRLKSIPWFKVIIDPISRECNHILHVVHVS